MRSSALRLLIIGMTVALSACSNVSSYRGDGTIIDNGWRLKGGRYTVDLGPIDVARPNKYSYRLQGLPKAEFVIGIEIVETTPIRFDQPPNHKAQVRLDIKDSDGEYIVREQSSLGSWVQSYGSGDTKSFVYQRGESKEVSTPNGTTQLHRVGVKKSDGWGSYFTAGHSSSYQVTFEILASEMPQRPARLILKSVDQ